jgi:hypothetical protein
MAEVEMQSHYTVFKPGANENLLSTSLFIHSFIHSLEDKFVPKTFGPLDFAVCRHWIASTITESVPQLSALEKVFENAIAGIGFDA